MKRIIPFNNILDFKTDISEITSISLEPHIDISSTLISGDFIIEGEYKITDGQLEKETFKFNLPFDIAITTNYDLDTLVIDVDDFRYSIIDRNKLKVNIDLFIEGEELIEEVKDIEFREIDNILLEEDNTKEEEMEEEKIEEVKRDIELLSDMLEDNIEEKKEEDIDIDIINNNIDNYVTYRIYPVCEGDTIDKIVDKYKISKEEISKYNNIENIKVGDKLLIPEIYEK